MSTATNESIITAPVAAKLPHFSISFELDGFPVVAEVEGKADSLKAIIERLKGIGAQPLPKATVTAAKPNGAPVCPVHQAPMKASRKPGKFYCAKKADDGEYCRETA